MLLLYRTRIIGNIQYSFEMVRSGFFAVCVCRARLWNVVVVIALSLPVLCIIMQHVTELWLRTFLCVIVAGKYNYKLGR